jgi:hypothetical protein
MRFLQNLTLAAAALSGLSLAAMANGGIPEAGSLLLYPTFDNTRGGDTIITVTNTNGDHNPTSGTLEAGTVDVEFVYINGYTCQEFNRTRRLTPNDSLTVSARLDNPNEREGYVYVFAKSPTTGQAISWNWLIGIERTVEGGGSDQDFDTNPYVFKAVGAQGSNTDLNGDHLRQLNGTEYEAGPDQLLFPRFVGQDNDDHSELTLINLTGAGQFTAVVDFLIYNDNEEVFSAQYDFFCWKEVDLDHISGIFTENFLESTNDASNEQVNGDEYGWFRLNGNIAISSADSELDPMILAILAENIGVGDGGELPFGQGTQTNGELVSHSIFHP